MSPPNGMTSAGHHRIQPLSFAPHQGPRDPRLPHPRDHPWPVPRQRRLQEDRIIIRRPVLDTWHRGRAAQLRSEAGRQDKPGRDRKEPRTGIRHPWGHHPGHRFALPDHPRLALLLDFRYRRYRRPGGSRAGGPIIYVAIVSTLKPAWRQQAGVFIIGMALIVLTVAKEHGVSGPWIRHNRRRAPDSEARGAPPSHLSTSAVCRGPGGGEAQRLGPSYFSMGVPTALPHSVQEPS